MTAAAVCGLIISVTVWPAAAQWLVRVRHPVGAGLADVLGVPLAGLAAPVSQPEIVSVAVANRP